VDLGPLPAGQAQQYGDGELDARGPGFFAHVDHRLGGGALVDGLEGDIVTGFQPHVGDADAVFPQFLLTLPGFHLQAFGVGVDPHPGHPGQLPADFGQNVQQPFLGNDQGVAVAQKHPALPLAVVAAKAMSAMMMSSDLILKRSPGRHRRRCICCVSSPR
jgi:hypothetical protein